MKKTKPAEYYGGRIKNLVEMVAVMIAKDPTLATNLPHLHATLGVNLEGYGKRDKCFNCKRSMKISVYTADLLDALLLLAMAKEVKKNLRAVVKGTETIKKLVDKMTIKNKKLLS